MKICITIDRGLIAHIIATEPAEVHIVDEDCKQVGEPCHSLEIVEHPFVTTEEYLDSVVDEAIEADEKLTRGE